MVIVCQTKPIFDFGQLVDGSTCSLYTKFGEKKSSDKLEVAFFVYTDVS